MASSLPRQGDAQWTLHWPFPEFVDDAVDVMTDSDDGDGTTVARPHALSSDWVHDTTLLPLSGGRPPVGSMPLAAPHDPTTPATGSDSAATISKAELASLVGAVRGRTTELTPQLRKQLENMDLRWIAPRRGGTVRPPALRLNLANLSSRATEAPHDGSAVLVNSPRSAVVLLRNGLCVSDLLRRRRAPQRTRDPDASAIAMGRCRAESAHRRSRMIAVEAEYDVVRRAVPTEDIVEFCSRYDSSAPASAALIEFAGAPAPALAIAVKQRARTEALADRRARAHGHTSRIRAWQEVALRSVTGTVVARIESAEGRARSAAAARDSVRRHVAAASSGRTQLWQSRRAQHDRTEAFRRVVARERLVQRLGVNDAAQAAAAVHDH